MKDPEQTKKQLKDEIKKLQSQIKELQKENDRVKYISETKKANLKLQEGEEKFRSITEQMSDMIFLTNEMGIITFISPASEALFGYKTEEMEGTPFTNFLEESQIEYAVKQFQLAVTTNSPTKNLELKMKHKDGSLFFGELTGKLYQSGDLIGTIGVIRDITERKQAEAVLKKSETKLRNVLDATPFPIAVVDLQDNKILYWSKSAYELFGHTAPTASEWYKIAYPDPDYRKQVIERWKPILEKSHELEQTVNAGEYNVTCRDGSVRICELHAKFISENLIVTFNDITDKKHAEAALLNQIAFQKNITDTSPIGIVRVDAEGQITFANPEAEIILGLEKSDILNRTYNDPKWSITDFYGNDFPQENLPFSQVKKLLKPVKNILHAIKFPDGKTTYLSINASPEFNENSQFNGMVATLSDITKSKRSEEALKKQERFISAIAETSPTLIYVYDMETSSNVYVNSGMERLLGYSAKEIQEMGDKVFSLLIHPDDLDEVIAFQSKILTAKDQDVLEVEYRMKHRNGNWVELHSFERVFVRNTDNSVKQKIGAAIDVTERKKTELALKNKEELIRSTGKMAKVGGWELDVKTNKVNWSEETYRIHEVPLDEEPPLEDAINFFHPDDRPLLQQALQNAIEQAEPYDLTLRFITASGKNLITHTMCQPVLEDGKVVKLFGTFQDITKLKQTEESLKESEERFNLAMKASKDGIFDWNLVTNEIYYSPGWKSMLGYEYDEIPNDFSIWETNTDPEDVKLSWQMQQELINKQRNRFEMEFKMKHKDGHWVDILSRAEAFFDKSGKAVRIVGTHVDITERKKAAEAITENDRILRNSQRIAKIGSWNWNFISDKAEWSKEIIEMYGRNVKDGSPNNEEWKKLIHQDDWEQLNSHVNEVKAGDCEYNIEYRIKRADTGEIRYIHSLGEVVFENGIPARLIGVDQDITDRKKAEEELKKKMHDLEIFNDAAVGRELMINELRKEINELLTKLCKEPKYKIIT
jgi:PAS domain S-box-containing protein